MKRGVRGILAYFTNAGSRATPVQWSISIDSLQLMQLCQIIQHTGIVVACHDEFCRLSLRDRLTDAVARPKLEVLDVGLWSAKNSSGRSPLR